MDPGRGGGRVSVFLKECALYALLTEHFCVRPSGFPYHVILEFTSAPGTVGVSADPADKGAAQHGPPFQMPVTGSKFAPWRIPHPPPRALRTQGDSLFARLPGHCDGYSSETASWKRGESVWPQHPCSRACFLPSQLNTSMC